MRSERSIRGDRVKYRAARPSSVRERTRPINFRMLQRAGATLVIWELAPNVQQCGGTADLCRCLENCIEKKPSSRTEQSNRAGCGSLALPQTLFRWLQQVFALFFPREIMLERANGSQDDRGMLRWHPGGHDRNHERTVLWLLCVQASSLGRWRKST